MKPVQLLLITILAIAITACASSNSGNVYKREDARKVQTVKTGVVESVRIVRLEGTKTPIGTVAGGAIGGIAGGSVGSGRSSAITAIIGALVGGLAGAFSEEAITRKNGVEITVKLDGGGLIAIVQEADEPFAPGEKVRIIEDGDSSRVSH